MTINIIAFFCDDIREEKRGPDTIIGILPDTIGLAEVPAVLPKLAFYIRVHGSLDARFDQIALSMRHPSGEILALGGFSADVVAKAVEKAKQNNVPQVGFILKGIATPFHMASVGRIEILATIGSDEMLIGWLNVTVATETELADAADGSRVTIVTPAPSV